MDSNITKAQIDELRDFIKSHTPYDEDDPILHTFDAELDPDRMRATTARRLLAHLGIDANDNEDYGDIID